MGTSTVSQATSGAPRLRIRTAGVCLVALASLAVAWGAFSFGAVYPWGYWPLLAACVAAGGAGLLIPPRSHSEMKPLTLVFGAIGVVVLAQLVPLPRTLLLAMNAAREAVLANYDLLYANAPAGHAFHPLSINPVATRLGLACFVAFAILLTGAVRYLSVRGTTTLVACVVVIGVVLALMAMVQDLTFNGKIYGFWLDPYENKPYGPFINKNNFAGWMLMAVPLALGFAAATAVSGMRQVAPNWHARVMWLSSASGSCTLLLVTAAFTMAVSLVFSLSRSGMVALTVALAVTAVFIAGRGLSRARRALVVLAMAGFLALLVGWAGTDTIARRFNDGTAATLQGRIGAWKDAFGITGRFPVVGVGLNAFPTAMLFYQAHDPDNFWSEAHNDYLQLTAEGGVLLLLPAAAALFLVVRGIRRRFAEETPARTSYWMRTGATAALIAIGVQELVEFSLQIPGNACLFAIVVATALHQSPSVSHGPTAHLETEHEMRRHVGR